MSIIENKELFKNELDELLYHEFCRGQPSERSIRELVNKGANVNALDRHENYPESMLLHVINLVVSPEVKHCWGEGLDIKYIKLLVELGADVNYAVPGQFNCLWDAQNVWNPELVEILLKAGANPNCISEEQGCISLLDWVTTDQRHEEGMNRGGKEPLTKIVALLKQYGAKHIHELKESE